MRLKYFKIKRVKLINVIPKGRNLINTNLFFNGRKYRSKKWSQQRRRTVNELIYNNFVLRRYNLNTLYWVFCPLNLLNSKLTLYKYRVKNIYKYRDLINLRYKLLIYFHFIRVKLLKKLLVHRHFCYKFDSFDNNIIFLLVKLGLITNSFRHARRFLGKYGLRQNTKAVADPYRSINFEDILSLSRKKKGRFRFYEYRYEKMRKRYIRLRKNLRLTFYSRLRFLEFIRLVIQKDKSELMVRFSNELNVNKILPMPFPVNYQTFTFYYMPLKIKNQWTVYYNMFFAKKFLQYNR
jgi:hypothetical protein